MSVHTHLDHHGHLVPQDGYGAPVDLATKLGQKLPYAAVGSHALVAVLMRRFAPLTSDDAPVYVCFNECLSYRRWALS